MATTVECGGVQIVRSKAANPALKTNGDANKLSFETGRSMTGTDSCFLFHLTLYEPISPDST